MFIKDHRTYSSGYNRARSARKQAVSRYYPPRQSPAPTFRRTALISRGLLSYTREKNEKEKKKQKTLNKGNHNSRLFNSFTHYCGIFWNGEKYYTYFI